MIEISTQKYTNMGMFLCYFIEISQMTLQFAASTPVFYLITERCLIRAETPAIKLWSASVSTVIHGPVVNL